MSKLINKLILIYFLSFMFSVSVLAAEIWTQSSDYRESGGGQRKIVNVVIEGVIRRGDYHEILSVLKEAVSTAHVEIILRSPGGDYNEAIRIGRLLRLGKLSANIPKWVDGVPTCSADDVYPTPKDVSKNCTCASACAFIYFGAAYKNGTVLGVHRPYFAQDYFSNLSSDEAAEHYRLLSKHASIYLIEMGVPQEIQKRIIATASNDVEFLDPSYLKEYMWGWIPEIDEWILAKCPSTMSARRSRELSQKFLDGVISKSESDELNSFFSANELRKKCVIDAEQSLSKAGLKAILELSDERIE